MRRVEPRTYETADELERRLNDAEAKVVLLDGAEKQAALIELAKLRNYANMKRRMQRDQRRQPCIVRRSGLHLGPV